MSIKRSEAENCFETKKKCWKRCVWKKEANFKEALWLSDKKFWGRKISS